MMAKPYSQDLRERVIAAMEGGLRTCACARLFQVSASYVSKVMGRKLSTGETTARPLGRGPKAKLLEHHDALRQRVAAVPDATLAELQAWLAMERGVQVSVSRIWTTLQRLRLPLKKRRSMPPSRSGLTLRRLATLGAQPSRA
jgi:transposase